MATGAAAGDKMMTSLSAWPNTAPPDTSLTTSRSQPLAANFRVVEIWSAVAILYLLMTGTLTLILRVTEKRMRIL